MAEIWTMGETLVEIMRTKENSGLDNPDLFKGPYPSGAPAIFIDTAARLGHKCGIISGVGEDDFGKCILERLKKDGVDVSQIMTDTKNSTGCAFVTYFTDGSRKFIFHLGNTPAAAAKAPDMHVLDGTRYFHVMGCSLFAKLEFAQEILKTVKMAKQAGAKISFDPNIRTELMGDTKIGVITSSTSYQYVKEVFGENACILKLGMVNPLPEKLILDFASKVEKLVIVEELDPIIENFCRKIGVEVIGKDVFPRCGEFSAKLIREKVLGEKAEISPASVPARPPVLCAGCPHRGVFYVLSKLKLNVLGDIGCYTLGAVPPLGSMDAVVCMGASIGMAIGFDKADSQAHKHSVAVIGDSTFIHSGITGLIDAVYNKAKVTVVILDNRTTGMTGHQNHPATGKTIKNEPTYELNLEEVCRAVGVKDVVTVDPGDLAATEKAVKAALANEDVSVIIAKKPCVLLTKKLYTGFKVNEKCRKCKACLKLGCPAIVNGKNGITIDVSLCTECGLCQGVCKFGAIDGEVK